MRLHSGISGLNLNIYKKRKREVRPVILIKISPHPVCFFFSQTAFFYFIFLSLVGAQGS